MLEAHSLMVAVAVVTLLGPAVLAQRGSAPPTTPRSSPLPPAPPNPRLDALKKEVVADVESRRVFTQQLVDSLFSYQRARISGSRDPAPRHRCAREAKGSTFSAATRTCRHRGCAKWGSGHPIIAIGTDIDGLPTTNQTPGVVTRKELVPGAPGHGEGHNAGQALVHDGGARREKDHGAREAAGHASALARRRRGSAGLQGAFLREPASSRTWMPCSSRTSAASWASAGARAAAPAWCRSSTSFTGSSSHAAAAPWLGKSALDAVELMDIAWNFKREHLRTQQRSHYVITNGGDQPNVVPPDASVWYYFRETDYDHIKELWDLGDTMAKAASMMTGTTSSSRVLGSAWPQHGNRPIAEVMFDNIKSVGLPQWSDADQQFAQGAFSGPWAKPSAGSTRRSRSCAAASSFRRSSRRAARRTTSATSCGAIPTITMRFPSNIPGAIGHHWTSAIAMATPVAHKGATQGAKATR